MGKKWTIFNFQPEFTYGEKKYNMTRGEKEMGGNLAVTTAATTTILGVKAYVGALEEATNLTTISISTLYELFCDESLQNKITDYQNVTLSVKYDSELQAYVSDVIYCHGLLRRKTFPLQIVFADYVRQDVAAKFVIGGVEKTLEIKSEWRGLAPGEMFGDFEYYGFDENNNRRLLLTVISKDEINLDVNADKIAVNTKVLTENVPHCLATMARMAFH